MTDSAKNSDANSPEELILVLRALHSNEPMPLELTPIIQSVTMDLSKDLGNNFQYLKSVMKRHEPDIRRRWTAKTRNERRALLLKVSPHMPEKHRADLDLCEQEAFANSRQTSSLNDTLLWPYINLEDLCKTQPLLVFLNARAYDLPWTFAASEQFFSPFGQPRACPDHCNAYIGAHMLFTKHPSPGVYGHLEDNSTIMNNSSEDSIACCPRQGLHLLYVQQHIMAFLVACVREILHDKSEEALLSAPILTEDSRADVIDAVNKGSDHTVFADTVLLAPYRARSTVDFHRLRAYLAGLFNNAKDHVWALREDPSYMADTITDGWNHLTELILDTKGQVHWSVSQPYLKAKVARHLIREAYYDLAVFKTLYETTDRLCSLFKDGVVHDLHANYHAVQMIDIFAREIKIFLSRCIRLNTWSCPGMRHLYTRLQGPRQLDFKIKSHQTEDALENEPMLLFDNFSIDEEDEGEDLVFFFTLDRLDWTLPKYPKAQTVVSPTVSEKLGKLSIIAECMQQLRLWKSSPELQRFLDDHEGNCKERLDEKEGLPHFLKWFKAINNYTPLISAIDIPQGRLNYPVHHFSNRQNTEQMRAAENNLDAFWNHVDTFFAETAGQAQHDLIQPYLAGHMRRTPPWVDEKSSASEPVYVPLSKIFHDISKQVTGVFDRGTGVGHAKTKTHGAPSSAQTAATASSLDSNTKEQSEKLDHVKVEKRTFKTIKSIFGMHAQAGDVPKVVKWDEFKRTMIRTGFSAEKLQGSAWQFTPLGNTDVGRSIQFHEPHPDSDIPYALARRFGRRLERVYGWTRDTFQLA
ncbi:hypothetical protein P171DRAFT_347641 [Karstenula rhodostoma CBS 690.94]|uniref:Uncharacterized protein n=1 Tax=Karstenula rhodostoma CBS 690.94 TaxID=1392251 RepID=A0A9P4PUN3_9PLEO|nr:hypothetical protein P171DRAFT_347641 [Karstenula rhodostoma CBS 690.94]